MIQSVKRGLDLLLEINETQSSRPTLWWLGQSGFVLKYYDLIFYVDPYLSDFLAENYNDPERPRVRMMEAPLTGEQVTHADLILCTHQHESHMDPESLPAMLSASPRARLVLPKSAAEHAHGFGIDYSRMSTTDADLRIEFFKSGIYARVYAAPSAHEELGWTPLGGYPCLGYLIRFGGYTIYHAGDCVPYEGLAERLRRFNVTVALLPINGRDSRRGIPGNFDVIEAAQLAEDIGARWLVPMHYDMFSFSTVDVNRFIEHLLGSRPFQRFKVFKCGEKWTVPKE
jgi:L-ascorbate 6-phosphate lactonase